MPRKLTSRALQLGNPTLPGADDPAVSKQIAAFRDWLRDVIASHPSSVNSIEVEAGIRGNALGKFLRGQRGGRHSLTPLMIRRIAPVLGRTEEDLLHRAGHLSEASAMPSVERAVIADRGLAAKDKALLLEMYRRIARAPSPHA